MKVFQTIKGGLPQCQFICIPGKVENLYLPYYTCSLKT